MNVYSRLLFLLSFFVLAVSAWADPVAEASPAPSPEETTLTKVGQTAPAVLVTTLDGDVFDLAAQRGKVVWLNFWATWCPPCREEFPHLRDLVWERFRERDDFVLISIAREEDAETIAPFVHRHGYDWIFAPDPDRSVFARFADAFIPRNYVIDRAGTIRYQSQGFHLEEFAHLVAALAAVLDADPTDEH